MARSKYSGSKYMRAAQSFGDYQKSIYEASDFSEIGKIKASAIEDRASRQQKLFGLASEALVTVDKLQGIKKTEGKVEDAVGKYEEMSGEQIDYSKVSLKDIISGDAKLSDYGKESFKLGDQAYTQAEMLAYGEKSVDSKFDKMLGIETPKTASKGDFLDSLQGSVEQMEGYTKSPEEGGVSDEIRANQNPGNVQYYEGIDKEYKGVTKGSSYVDTEGVERHHAKFTSIEQGRDASRKIIEKHWEKAGGDAYKFASNYTGNKIDSTEVRNYGGQIERDLGKNTNYAQGWEGGTAEASGWKYGETRNQYSKRIGKDIREQGLKDNPGLDDPETMEDYWAMEDKAEAGGKRMDEWKASQRDKIDLQDYAKENEISLKDAEKDVRRSKDELTIFDKLGDFLDKGKPMSAESLEESGLGEFAVQNEQELFDDSKAVAKIGGKAVNQSQIDKAMEAARGRIEGRPSKFDSTMSYLFGKRDNLISTRSLAEDIFGTK